MLIRLRSSAGWSAPLLLAYNTLTCSRGQFYTCISVSCSMNDIGSLQSDILELTIIGLKYEMGVVKVSEYDQEIPQSHTADQPTAP